MIAQIVSAQREELEKNIGELETEAERVEMEIVVQLPRQTVALSQKGFFD